MICIVKFDADGQPVLTSCASLTEWGGMNFDERFLGINLCLGTRKFSYVQFLKRTFACCMVF